MNSKVLRKKEKKKTEIRNPASRSEVLFAIQYTNATVILHAFEISVLKLFKYILTVTTSVKNFMSNSKNVYSRSAVCLLFFCTVIFLFRGTSGIDIDLRRVDINQCPTKGGGGINIFGGTDKCKKDTTFVSNKNELLYLFTTSIKRYL